MDELFMLRTYIFHLSILGAAAALLSRMLLGNTALRKCKRDPRLHVITLHHSFELMTFMVYAYCTGQHYHAS